MIVRPDSTYLTVSETIDYLFVEFNIECTRAVMDIWRHRDSGGPDYYILGRRVMYRIPDLIKWAYKDVFEQDIPDVMKSFYPALKEGILK